MNIQGLRLVFQFKALSKADYFLEILIKLQTVKIMATDFGYWAIKYGCQILRSHGRAGVWIDEALLRFSQLMLIAYTLASLPGTSSNFDAVGAIVS